MEGHSWKRPDVGRLLQVPLPPSQFKKPDFAISDAPISITTMPVISGGKILFKARGGMNASPIITGEHSAAVPSSRPYAFGL